MLEFLIEAGIIILGLWLGLYATTQSLVKGLAILNLMMLIGLLTLKIGIFPELEWVIVLGMPIATFVSGIAIDRFFRNLEKNR